MTANNDLNDILYKGAEKYGIQLSDEQIKLFFAYKDILLQWNEKMNLTAITDEKEIFIKHFVDSLSVVSNLNIIQSKKYKVVDVGTGAGFPGLALKIAFPELYVTLLDSLNKRINFLNETVNHLSLKNVENIHLRAEDGGKSAKHREKYDYCFSRAVARLSILAEYCIPYVKMGGLFTAMKGPDCFEEINEAKIIIEMLGGEISSVNEIILPFSDIKHTNIVIKKVRQTPSNYPRSYAQMTKKPAK